jgi:hypothetical protein
MFYALSCFFYQSSSYVRLSLAPLPRHNLSHSPKPRPPLASTLSAFSLKVLVPTRCKTPAPQIRLQGVHSIRAKSLQSCPEHRFYYTDRGVFITKNPNAMSTKSYNSCINSTLGLEDQFLCLTSP